MSVTSPVRSICGKPLAENRAFAESRGVQSVANPGTVKSCYVFRQIAPTGQKNGKKGKKTKKNSKFLPFLPPLGDSRAIFRPDEPTRISVKPDSSGR